MTRIISVPVSLIEVKVGASVWGVELGNVEGPAINGWSDTREDAFVRKLCSVDFRYMMGEPVVWRNEEE